MLVLSRKYDQKVRIYAPNGDQIEILMIGIKQNGSVRLGFEAPMAYRIVRAEIDKGPEGGLEGTVNPVPRPSSPPTLDEKQAKKLNEDYKK